MNQNLDFRTSLNRKKRVHRDKSPVNRIKIITGIKLDENQRKIQHFKEIQKSIQQGNQQITQIQQQLQKVDRHIKQKKREIIQKKLQQIWQSKRQRQKFINKSDEIVNMVKQKNESKKMHMEYITKQAEQKQSVKYKKTLKQRVNRYRNPINFDQIRQHQCNNSNLQYSVQLKAEKPSQNRSRNQRVKSQMGMKYQNQFENLPNDYKSIIDERVKDQFIEERMEVNKVKMQAIKLTEKKTLYGDRVQKLRKNSRLKTGNYSESKREFDSRLFWEKINVQNESKIRQKKPKLYTNLPRIELKECVMTSFKKITEDKNLETSQKIQKLRRIENSYVQRLRQNNPQAVDIISQLSLMKADLYLKA